MSFWSSKYNAYTGTGLDVLQKFKYSIEIQSLGVLWYAKSVQFPKLSQEKQEAISGFGGNAVYKPGPAKWQPITLTFADVMIDSTYIDGLGEPISTQMLWFSLADILDSFQQDSGFLVSREQDKFFNSPIPFETLVSTLNSDRDKLAEIRIHKHYFLNLDNLFNSDTIIESWRIQDIIISELDFGQGDYSSDDINEISVTLSYDIAHLYYKNKGGESDVALISDNKRSTKVKEVKTEAKTSRYKKSINTLY